MSRLLFSVRYGLRSILRGGTRTALALACVAFGALAYTGTLLLTDAVESALLPPAREATGGDLVLSGDGLLGADQVDALTRLVGSAGAVETAALAPVSASFLQTVGSGRLTIVSRVLGVEAETYPVAGPLRMRDGTLADALARPDGAVVTRDLAQSLDLAVGDSIRLARGVGEPPTRFAVTGVAEQVPDRFGNTILLSIDGARRAEGRQRVVAQVAVATADTAAVASAAEAAGWRVRRASLPDESLANAFGTMLPAAGLLGLLLAGVGIATTIQVTLARRRDEIAALKAVGYRRRDVVGLFAAEMVLLGLGGGVIGVVAGLGLAAGLYRALSGALPILIEPSYDPAVLAAGVLAGVATATVFGVATSVRASGVRPAALLRGEAVQMPRATGAAIVGLGVALLLVYGTLAGLLVGSVPLGIGMVALGAAGVIVVGGGLAFALSLLARLPVGSAFVRRSLQRRPWRTAAALAALVVGVFAVATAGGAIETGTQAVERQTVFFSDETVMVAGLRSDSAAVASEAARLGLPVRRVVTVPVSQATIGGTPAAVDRLEGRAIDGGDWNLEIEEGRWIAGPGEALASTFSEIAVGDRVRIETDRGPQVDVEIVGTYGFRSGGMLARASGLLVADRQADALGATAAAYFLSVLPDDIAASAERLGRALPEAAVLTGDDVNAYLARLFQGLFVFVLAIAGLAFGGGAVLIANTVGLSLVERRTELAVLKAVGYSSGRVLGLVAIETAIVGAFAGAVGAVSAVIAVQLVGASFDVDVSVAPGIAAAAAIGAALLAVATALVVASGAVRVRPLAVLRSGQ